MNKVSGVEAGPPLQLQATFRKVQETEIMLQHLAKSTHRVQCLAEFWGNFKLQAGDVCKICECPPWHENAQYFCGIYLQKGDRFSSSMLYFPDWCTDRETSPRETTGCRRQTGRGHREWKTPLKTQTDVLQHNVSWWMQCAVKTLSSVLKSPGPPERHFNGGWCIFFFPFQNATHGSYLPSLFILTAYLLLRFRRWWPNKGQIFEF